jgi:hypothetical protein
MLKSIQPRLVELGKIKLGGLSAEVRKNDAGREWRLPVKLDHFRITTMQRNAAGDLIDDTALMKRLIEKHGSADGKLREIPIALLSDDVDEVLPAAWCLYTKKAISARCDEVTCTKFLDARGQPLKMPVQTPCTGEHENRDAGWRCHTTLNCVIATAGARWGGIYRMRTTSEISLEQLYGTMVNIQQLTGGVLQGIPLCLVLRPVQVSPTVNGRVETKTVYVTHVEMRGDDLAEVQKMALASAQLRIANARQINAAKQEYLKMLRAPGADEPMDEQEDVSIEFHPGEENSSAPGELVAKVAQPIAATERLAAPVPREPEPQTPFDDPEAGRPDNAPASTSLGNITVGDLNAATAPRDAGDDSSEIEKERAPAAAATVTAATPAEPKAAPVAPNFSKLTPEQETKGREFNTRLEACKTAKDVDALTTEFLHLDTPLKAMMRKPFVDRRNDLVKSSST